MQRFLAHIRKNGRGDVEYHGLEPHLRGVEKLAVPFSAPFAPDAWARLAGRWHDLGKYQPDFLRYLRSANGLDAHIETAPNHPKHAIAGAIHAAEALGAYGRLLAYLIAGHHAGLPDWWPGETSGAALSQELREQTHTLANAKAGGIPAEILSPAIDLPAPPITEARELHLWLRMLFSCLVDADFLDTEEFMDPERFRARGDHAAGTELREAYDCYMARSFAVANTPVKLLREEIRTACLARAGNAPGLFTLTVPTGGGKTLASLGFALHHAAKHSLRRVIYVIPYTSIIEQTADVFRRVFAGIEPMPVIEHHSNLDAMDETRENAKSRLAAENWDAPVVVTTTVQFFESLYAARGSRCRKLHNIAQSVVILDEAQLLPPEHLSPVLDVLRQLKDRYGVSIVLSTATQPELGNARYDPLGRVMLQGLGEARELAPDPARLYRELDRVAVSLPASARDRRSWDEIADELAAERQVLCIVNRRDDAEVLWRKMRARGTEGLVHLSARLCGAHRAEVIARVKAELATGRPLRVVSTQLVEAGVDFDFPVVYRAMAGLDSLAQAAGRCNREGRLSGKGRVVVFNPPKPSPRGLLLKAEQAAINVLHGSCSDPLAPANYAPYFDSFYWSMNSHDKEGVLDLLTKDAARGQIQFRTAAAKFRLIPEEGQRPVFVRWGEGAVLIEDLRAQGPHRALMRRLQRHAVTLHDREWQKLLASRDLELHAASDCLIQKSDALYHADLGLLPEVPDYEPDSLVG